MEHPPFNIHVKNVTFIGFLNYTTTNKMYVRQLIIIFYAHVAKSLTLTEDKAPLEPQDRLLKSKVKTETIRFQSETEHVESLTRLERVIEDLKRQLQKVNYYIFLMSHC